VRRLAAEFGASERHACELMEIARTTHRYPSRRQEQLLRLAREKPRFGYRRIHILLQREGQGSTISGYSGSTGSWA